MKKLKIGLIIVAAILIIAELFIIDYNSLAGSKNMGNYMVIMAMIMLVLSQVAPLKNNKK
ncbi:hypothetical protein [uncultured Draconibacterium sp.]|uniref:hypothetical protein n=1 Tax=uncultured Draconibacterium sp. TaxID=1573823 RepID=UPI002AA74976|nr:hypothetical protein [uncultured Draconibacterium sp.]